MFGVRQTSNVVEVHYGPYINISEGPMCIPSQSHAFITCLTALLNLHSCNQKIIISQKFGPYMPYIFMYDSSCLDNSIILGYVV
jgi:hypothetical protein